jgi:hypothetical protein
MGLKPHEKDLLAGLPFPPPGEWGGINSVRQIAQGMIRIQCEGHGGVGITIERNARIPESQRASDCWYEEDICMTLPIWVFRDEVVATLGAERGNYAVESSASTIRNEMPDAWTELTGEKLDATSSSAIRQAEFKQRHALDWTVRSAFGHSGHGYPGVPEGMVGYLAYQTANADRYGNPRETRGFLVTTEEAVEVQQRGHIIDLAKAQPIPVRSLGFAATFADYTDLQEVMQPGVRAYCWQPPDLGKLQIRLFNGTDIDLVSTRGHADWGRLLAYPDFEGEDKIWYFATAKAMMAGAIRDLPQSTIQSTHIYMLSATMPPAALLRGAGQNPSADEESPSP